MNMKRAMRWVTGSVAAVALAGVGVMGFVSTADADMKTGGAVGTAAPDFELKDLDGKTHKLSDYTSKGKIVVLEWFNPDCPWVVKHYVHNKTMNTLSAEWRDKDVVWLAVNSNAPGTQGDGLERNQRAFREFEMKHPVLLDPTNRVAHAYGATRTPEMVIIDKEGKVVYRGAIDNDPSPRQAGSVNYVQQALTQLANGETIAESQTRPYGCTVKYRN